MKDQMADLMLGTVRDDDLPDELGTVWAVVHSEYAGRKSRDSFEEASSSAGSQ